MPWNLNFSGVKTVDTDNLTKWMHVLMWVVPPFQRSLCVMEIVCQTADTHVIFSGLIRKRYPTACSSNMKTVFDDMAVNLRYGLFTSIFNGLQLQ